MRAAVALSLALAACATPSVRPVLAPVKVAPGPMLRATEADFAVVDANGVVALHLAFAGRSPIDVARACGLAPRKPGDAGWVFVRVQIFDRRVAKATLVEAHGVDPAWAACVVAGVATLEATEPQDAFDALVYLTLR